MVKKNIFLFIDLFMIFSISAQAPEKGLLWKISGKDLKQSSYLFGTYHGTYDIGSEFLDSIPGFNDAFTSVTQYAGESDFLTNAGLNEYFAKYYGQQMMPTDTTYEDLLNKADYDYLDLTLRVSARIFMKDANNIRPNYLWFIIRQAKISDYMQQIFNVPKKETMDIYLQKVAWKKGYTVKGLDTPEMRVKSLELINGTTPLPQSLRESADTLINNIKQLDKTLNAKEVNPELIKNMKNFENAYKIQDLLAMEKYKKEQIDMIRNDSNLPNDIDQNMSFLIDERSSSWMEKIPELISNQPTMIGVGAMHLCGKDGLINLLREKGYILEVVKK